MKQNVETGGAAAMAKPQTPRCLVCSCTDERACYGGCSWAAADVCSRCAPLVAIVVKTVRSLRSGAFIAPAHKVFRKLRSYDAAQYALTSQAVLKAMREVLRQGIEVEP